MKEGDRYRKQYYSAAGGSKDGFSPDPDKEVTLSLLPTLSADPNVSLPHECFASQTVGAPARYLSPIASDTLPVTKRAAKAKRVFAVLGRGN